MKEGFNEEGGGGDLKHSYSQMVKSIPGLKKFCKSDSDTMRIGLHIIYMKQSNILSHNRYKTFLRLTFHD